jgi:type III pantothenate kinase
LIAIMCGGGANFFESKIKGNIFAVPNLVLEGLNQVLRYNLHA